MHPNLYKEYTIKELIQALKQALVENSYIDENSPVLISDFNMSGYKHKFKLHPVMSPAHGTVGLCLFHSLENRDDDEFKASLELENGLLKFVRKVKEG